MRILILFVAILAIHSTQAQTNEPKTRRRGNYYPSGNVQHVYYAYKSGGKWIRHGTETIYYDVPKNKAGKRTIYKVLNWRHNALQGAYLEKYPSGLIKETGSYRNGKPDGQWRSFYPSGAKKIVQTFVNGQRHGKAEKFATNGQLLVESTYDKGMRHGVRKSWYANGVPESITKYVDDAKDGTELVFYDNRKPKSRTEYKFGKKNGMEKLWQEDGTPISEIQYINGKKEGMVRLFYPNGKTKSEIEYKDEKPHGSCKEYYANGVIKRSAMYQNALLHGAETNWYPTGQKRSTINYRFGKQEGLLIVYYPNNQPRYQHTIHQGKKHGPAAFFNKEGAVIARGNYVNDEPYEGTFVSEIEESESQYEIITVNKGNVTDKIFCEDGKPKNGPIKEYFPGSRDVYREAVYREGKLSGPETRYYRSGQEEYKITWMNNKPDGTVIQWHPNGTKMWEAQFNAGVKDGTEKAWDIRGRLLCDGTHKAGKPWNGTLLVNDEKTGSQVIRIYKNGIASEEMPANVAKMLKAAKLPDILRMHNRSRR